MQPLRGPTTSGSAKVVELRTLTGAGTVTCRPRFCAATLNAAEPSAIHVTPAGGDLAALAPYA
jgi:hypothetical protein